MACSVGDGMTAAIDIRGALYLLGLEESGGKHSGETEFLTDPRSVTSERLRAQTFVQALPLRSIMVMTDGVADPYFPNNPGRLRLYADLILNGVLDFPGLDMKSLLRAFGERGLELPDLSKYSYLIDTPVRPDEWLKVRIRQSDRFAMEKNLSLSSLLADWPPAWLLAGASGQPMNEMAEGSSQEERLRIWLDAFYVRGEFDDRTLAILQRREAR
jgi:hypothetical protein